MMKRISSSMTRLNKKFAPAFWLGSVILFVAVGIFTDAAKGNPMFLVFPVLVGGVGYFFTRRLYMDLMDEVLDGGDFLLVRNDGKEERVALSNIANVSASLGSNMVRITLRLLVPSRLGSEIVFMPPLRTSFLSLTKSPVAEDLIARVQAARSRRGS